MCKGPNFGSQDLDCEDPAKFLEIIDIGYSSETTCPEYCPAGHNCLEDAKNSLITQCNGRTRCNINGDRWDSFLGWTLLDAAVDDEMEMHLEIDKLCHENYVQTSTVPGKEALIIKPDFIENGWLDA